MGNTKSVHVKKVEIHKVSRAKNGDVEHEDVKMYCTTTQFPFIVILWSTQQKI